MLNNLWLIPALPFAGFLLNGLFGSRAGKKFVSIAGPLFSGLSAVAATIAVIQYHHAYPDGGRFVNVVYNWISSGGIGADLAFQLDPLSVVMVMVVAWVGTLIDLYSVGDMGDGPGCARCFSFLNLFLGQILGLVRGRSDRVILVGWA